MKIVTNLFKNEEEFQKFDLQNLQVKRELKYDEEDYYCLIE